MTAGKGKRRAETARLQCGHLCHILQRRANGLSANLTVSGCEQSELWVKTRATAAALQGVQSAGRHAKITVAQHAGQSLAPAQHAMTKRAGE